MDFDKYGGRRFLLTLFSGIIASTLVFLTKIDGTVYASVILGTVGVYIAANTHEKIKTDSITKSSTE